MLTQAEAAELSGEHLASALLLEQAQSAIAFQRERAETAERQLADTRRQVEFLTAALASCPCGNPKGGASA